MTRWRLMLAGIVALPLLASCAVEAPAGTDGDLVNGWAAMTAPVPYQPKVGTCVVRQSRAAGSMASRHLDKLIGCDQPHDLQVVGAGQFDQSGATPAAIAGLDSQCDQLATAYVKEDWRNAFLDLTVVHAASATEADGARWWECVLSGYEEHLRVGIGQKRASRQLSIDLAAGIPAEIRLACQRLVYDGDVIRDQEHVPCATPHHAEYAGSMVFPIGTAYPDSDSRWAKIHDGCEKIVAAYVGVSPQRAWLFSEVIGDEATWSKRRDVRCFVFTGDKTMVGSAKGTKGKGVPW